MKLVAFLALIVSLNAFASGCKVYGISDSPQHLSCTFPEKVLRLSCQNDTYYLNSEMVSVAFHMEVEEGPVPLVFKSAHSQLTLLKQQKNYDAQLLIGAESLSGTCE